MFCVKCGTEISSSDIHCPKCGALNENFIPQKEKKKVSLPVSKKKEEHGPTEDNVNGLEEKKKKSKIFIPIIVVAIIICIVVCISFVITNKSSYSSSVYQPIGLSAIMDNEGTADFFVDGQMVSFKGNFSDGRSTQDHSKYILLNYDGTLMYFNSENSDPLVIASNVERILNVTNNGCAFAVNNKVTIDDILKKMSNSYRIDKSLNELKKEFADFYEDSVADAKKFYKERIGYAYISRTGNDKVSIYNFKSANLVELQISSDNIRFNDNSLTFASIDEKRKLSLYVEGADIVKELCSVGEEANLCGISPDGENVIWSEEKDGELLVYMLKNNIPERIGKLGKKQKYSLYPMVIFFDKGFVFTYKDYNTLIFSKNDEVKDVSFSGVMDLYSLLDADGNIINNSPCNTKYFYFTASKSKDGSISRLYRLDMNGTIQEIVSDLSSQYYIKGSTIYYVNDDNDFYVADIDQKGIINSNCVTTEISRLVLSEDGTVAYVVKADSLYYWDTKDKSYQLHQICNNFTSDSIIYFTETEGTIYYLKEMQEITDSYITMGTLYRYKKGINESEEIGSKVVALKLNDTKNHSSINPLIIQYSNKNSNDDNLYNICILNSDQMEAVIKDVISY